MKIRILIAVLVGAALAVAATALFLQNASLHMSV